MKSNNNQKGLVRKSLAVLGVLCIATVAFTVGTYSELARKMEGIQQDAKVLDHLVQAARFNMVIEQLNKGHVAEAKQYLNLSLVNDLSQADHLAASANPDAAGQAKCALEQFARDRKAHPEYYMVALRPAASQSPRSLQVARQDAKQ